MERFSPILILLSDVPIFKIQKKLELVIASIDGTLEGPIPFRKNIRVTIEHGHANHRSDNFYTVGYWYQTEPHKPFPPLPKADDRTPRVFAVGGPGIARP